MYYRVLDILQTGSRIHQAQNMASFVSSDDTGMPFQSCATDIEVG
jgi:hypothetical protein